MWLAVLPPSPIVNVQNRESHATYVTEARHTCDWVTSHMWLSHVTLVDCYLHQLWKQKTKFARVMPHLKLSHVAHVTESRHICDWVMSHMWRFTITNCQHYTPNLQEICHICDWDTSHTSPSHVTHVTESRHSCAWIIHTHTHTRPTSHVCLNHVTHVTFHHHQLYTPNSRELTNESGHTRLGSNLWMRL